MLWDFDQRQDTTCVTVQIYCKWECENYFHQVPIKLKFKESYCDTIKETYLENSETLSWATQTIVSVQETISPSLWPDPVSVPSPHPRLSLSLLVQISVSAPTLVSTGHTIHHQLQVSSSQVSGWRAGTNRLIRPIMSLLSAWQWCDNLRNLLILLILSRETQKTSHGQMEIFNWGFGLSLENADYDRDENLLMSLRHTLHKYETWKLGPVGRPKD